MYEAQYVARIEKIKIIGSTFMAACGLISGRKNSQDYDAATEQNTTEPFSKERLKETWSLDRPNSSIVSITFHSGLKTENYNCDVNADFIKLMTSSWYLIGLGLENKSLQIELLRSETSSSHHIMTISSSIAHNIKS